MVFGTMQHAASAYVLASPELIAVLRALAAKVGVVQAARAVGLSRQTFTTLVAGLKVQRGSIAVASQGIAAISARTSAVA